MEADGIWDHYRQHGYAVARDFLPAEAIATLSELADAVWAEAASHGRHFRHGNLFYHVAAGADGQPFVRMAQWPVWHHSGLDGWRHDPRYLAMLAPVLGPDIKQIIHQFHWKPAGTGSGGDFAWHQDSRSRRPRDAYRNLGTSYVQTGLAIDRHDRRSGCLRVIPGSHRRGELDLKADQVVLGRAIEDADLEAAGLDPASQVSLLLEPGDLALWSPYLMHASGENLGSHQRRLLIQGYVRAADCDRGEWAFRQGKPVPLPDRPSLTHWEPLFDHPDPHYP